MKLNKMNIFTRCKLDAKKYYIINSNNNNNGTNNAMMFNNADDGSGELRKKEGN